MKDWDTLENIVRYWREMAQQFEDTLEYYTKDPLITPDYMRGRAEGYRRAANKLESWIERKAADNV